MIFCKVTLETLFTIIAHLKAELTLVFLVYDVYLVRCVSNNQLQLFAVCLEYSVASDALRKMNRQSNYTEHEAVRASTLLDEGYSQRFVANLLGVNYSTISQIVRRFDETVPYSRRPGQGRKCCTSERGKRFLRQHALRNRTVTSSFLKNELQVTPNVILSARTNRRRLRECGLNSKRRTKALLLSRENRVARMRFAMENRNWSVNDWKIVVFSDETRESLNSPDGHERVWRKPGERFAQCNISPRIPFGDGSVMFWEGICYDNRN